MKWIVLLSLWSVAAFAQTPMVFMRESTAGKHVILRQGTTETPLTSGKMVHLYPDISADGQWVVWVEGPNERDLSVVLYNTRTRGRERWTTDRKGTTLHPRFSKINRQIFFSSPERGGNKIVAFNPANSRTRLMATEPDGTKVYRITPEVIPHAGEGFFPRPSSDGTFVIFQQSTLFRKEIIEYSLLTKKSRVLAEGISPALSIDEEWILYTSKALGSWDVWLANRLTGDTVSLTNDPGDEVAPTFTPNNDVIFASNKDKNLQLYKLVDGEWQRLVTSESDDTSPMLAGESKWQQSIKASLPKPQRLSFGSVQHAGKIYVCGGEKDGQMLSQFQVYDPSTGRWVELAPRPSQVHSFPLVASGNYIYAFGGAQSQSIDRYSIQENSWTTISSLPRLRASVQAVAIDEKIYLLGAGSTVVDIFDLATETITVASWIQLPRRDFSALEFKNHILLVGGGKLVTMIDPASGYSRELAPIPFSISHPSIETLGDDLLLFGGIVNNETRSSIYALNFTANRWRHTGRFLSEAKGLSKIVPHDRGLAILGGQDSGGTVATFEWFAPATK